MRRLGGQIDLVKAMTPQDQQACLDARAPTGTGPDFAGQRDQHALLSEAVAANRKARADDLHGYVTAVYPEIGKAWADAENDPQALPHAMAATSAAMEQLGIPPELRQLLPKAVVSRAVEAFVDPENSTNESLSPLRLLVDSTGSTTSQKLLVSQLVRAGLPSMAKYATNALMRGDDSAADRIVSALRSPSAPPEAILTDLIKQTYTQAPNDVEGILKRVSVDIVGSRNIFLYQNLVSNNITNNGNDKAAASAQAAVDMGWYVPLAAPLPYNEANNTPPVYVRDSSDANAKNDRAYLKEIADENKNGLTRSEPPLTGEGSLNFAKTPSDQDVLNIIADPNFKAVASTAIDKSSLNLPLAGRREQGYFIFHSNKTGKFAYVPMSGTYEWDPNRGYMLLPDDPIEIPGYSYMGSFHTHPVWANNYLPTDLDPNRTPDNFPDFPAGKTVEESLSPSPDDQNPLKDHGGFMLIIGPNRKVNPLIYGPQK